MNLVEQLKKERKAKAKNSLYRHLQVLMAYHSNKIEGSTCSLEETRLLFDTASYGKQTPTNDIIETFNHFRAFDMILDTYKQQLTEHYIKGLHGILKFNTMDIQKGYMVGDYKKIPNRVGTMITASPENVGREMQNLLNTYSEIINKNLRDVLNFHVKFEQIHPFQDGNGRVGRLIMFKECLSHKIPPFIISSDNNLSYKSCLMAYQLNMENSESNFINFAKQEQNVFKKIVIQMKGR